MNSKIFSYLKKLKLTSLSTRKLFNKGTRDNSELKVWRDEKSGVIYIDDFYIGNKTYVDGKYIANNELTVEKSKLEYEKIRDVERRFNANLKYVIGKNIADFGCGDGKFLKRVKPYCKNVKGIEIQKNYNKQLNKIGITCLNKIEDLDNKSIEVMFSFHVIEHLPDPILTLTKLSNKIVSGGYFLIEVPHANDFLLTHLSNKAFKNFTLWSQHLVLHTKESLKATLKFVGLKNIKIYGVQRYPLSNHLNWLANNKPGGHLTKLSSIDTISLFNEYEKSLSRIEATDTLVAIAKVP